MEGSAPTLTTRLRRRDEVRAARSVERTIAAMVQCIVERFNPDRVILFGSHARGDAGPDSDVDLLIVMKVEGSKRAKQLEIRAALHDFEVPKDVIVNHPGRVCLAEGGRRHHRAAGSPRWKGPVCPTLTG